MRHDIYLIPGFFGFADIGGITYFHHVREFLAERFAQAGIEAELHPVKTLPTASIRRRAGRLLETVSETAADDGPIHLIGHSTGGLDARLFTTPAANLIVDESYDLQLEPWARRVESVVTLSSPHFGTPMATVFSSLLGSQLLYLLSLGTIYTLQFGKLPLSLLIAVGGIVTRLDDSVGLENTVLDQWYEQLLDDFDLDRETAVKLFLDEIREDQSLVGQLTPGGIDLFNASTSNRDGVRYGSVVTIAREPSLATIKEFGFDPYRQASHGVFRALAFLTGGGTYENLSAEDEAFFTAHYETVPDRGATDGIVPTRSQVWGELIHAARGDHLDTVGHFDDPSHVPPHIDWLASGSKFRRPAFEALWSDVATFIAEATSMSSPRRSE